MVFLLKQGIRVVFSAVRHPQTQGKVERFHRTLAERLRWVGVPTTLAGFTRTLAWFREEYNEMRPHAALGLTPPAAHFTPSVSSLSADAAPVELSRRARDPARPPDGHHSASRATPTSSPKPSAGEDVACVPLADRILVIYRHMYVRELHPRRRQSVPLMQPVEAVWPMRPAPTC